MIPKERTLLIGMVHLLPLPGSPQWGGSMADIRRSATRDATRLLEGGCDALIVENMGDVPYLRGSVHPETTAAMVLPTADVVALGAPVGVQVLAGANRAALGVATASGATFIRVEGFAYGHLADEGWMDACAGPLLRARAALNANVAIWADIQKKHAAHAATGDLSLSDLSQGAAFCGADVLVVTGKHTGQAAQIADLTHAATAGIPIAVGSGVTPSNAHEMATHANALIVGSYVKEDGDWRAPVSVSRVRTLKNALIE